MRRISAALFVLACLPATAIASSHPTPFGKWAMAGISVREHHTRNPPGTHFSATWYFKRSCSSCPLVLNRLLASGGFRSITLRRISMTKWVGTQVLATYCGPSKPPDRRHREHVRISVHVTSTRVIQGRRVATGIESYVGGYIEPNSCGQAVSDQSFLIRFSGRRVLG